MSNGILPFSAQGTSHANRSSTTQRQRYLVGSCITVRVRSYLRVESSTFYHFSSSQCVSPNLNCRTPEAQELIISLLYPTSTLYPSLKIVKPWLDYRMVSTSSTPFLAGFPGSRLAHLLHCLSSSLSEIHHIK